MASWLDHAEEVPEEKASWQDHAEEVPESHESGGKLGEALAPFKDRAGVPNTILQQSARGTVLGPLLDKASGTFGAITHALNPNSPFHSAGEAYRAGEEYSKSSNAEQKQEHPTLSKVAKYGTGLATTPFTPFLNAKLGSDAFLKGAAGAGAISGFGHSDIDLSNPTLESTGRALMDTSQGAGQSLLLAGLAGKLFGGEKAAAVANNAAKPFEETAARANEYAHAPEKLKGLLEQKTALAGERQADTLRAVATKRADLLARQNEIKNVLGQGTGEGAEKIANETQGQLAQQAKEQALEKLMKELGVEQGAIGGKAADARRVLEVLESPAMKNSEFATGAERILRAPNAQKAQRDVLENYIKNAESKFDALQAAKDAASADKETFQSRLTDMADENLRNRKASLADELSSLGPKISKVENRSKALELYPQIKQTRQILERGPFEGPKMNMAYDAGKQALPPLIGGAIGSAVAGPLGGVGGANIGLGATKVAQKAIDYIAPRAIGATAQTFANVVKNTPQYFGRFGQTLSQAATQGDNKLHVTDYLLQQQHPEYRQKRQEMDKAPELDLASEQQP